MDPLEFHPYKPYIPAQAKKMIIGNFPIGKFSNPERSHERKIHELDFYYGGEMNRLWRLLGICFKIELNNVNAIKAFIKKHHFSLADILISCRRKNGSALDTALYDKTYNLELAEIIKKKKIKELIYTSKHVYMEFRKHIGKFPELKHTILISPSPMAIRGLVKNREFLELKRSNKQLSAEDFRLMKYQQVFS